MNQTVFPPVLIGDPDLTPCELAAKQNSWRSKLKSFFKQAITYTVLASLQLGTLVQTKEAYAQYVQYGGQPTNGQVNGQPNTGYVAPVAGAISGYTNDGTLFMGGQRIGNPHQILHDAQIPSFMNITATRYTFTNDPTHGQGTLAQMELATTNGSDSSVLLNRLYLSPTNPYVQGAPGPYPNYQTYQGVLQNAQQANYLLTNADDGKTYAFKTLTAANRQAVDLLIRELPNTSQFKAAADPLGGGTGVRVTQNGDAVALAAYLATVKPYDYSWQPNFGTTFGQNPAFSGWANSNNFAPDYSEGAGPAQSFQAFIKQLQDDAVANDKKVRSQTSANSLDLSGVNPNSLFGEGYNLFQYGSNSNPNRDLENDFLKRLQAGQLTAGSADYLEASRIAQERYRIAYATRLETNKPLQYSVADAQRKANELKLSGINANELFGQGFDLFKYNPALRANGAAENDLLARLQSGQLQAGSSEYQQAAEIAQQRLRDAYAQSLSPPPPKKVAKWKLIVGAVVGAVLTFVTAGAAAPFIGAALGVGSTVASAIAGVVASAVGTIASTTITTGSLSQGLKAGGKALISGGVKAIVASAIGMGFVGDILGAAAGQTVAYGGSFGDNLKGAVIGAAVTYVADGVGKQFAGAIKDAGLGTVGTELAHGALGCVTGMIRSQSGSGCVPGAVGAVVGHLGAGWVDAASGYTLDDKTLSFYSGVVGGAAAAAVGKDDKVNANFGIGNAAAVNAVDNNYLTGRDLLKGLAALKTCTVGCDALRRVYLGDNNANGGLQQGTGGLVSSCKSGGADCAGRVQDIKTALDELQKPETRVLLGDKATDALINRQVKDLGEAVTALQWGVDNAESRKAIFAVALTVGATAAGAGLALTVGRALIAACASGALSPTCITATTEVAASAMDAVGGVPVAGVSLPVIGVSAKAIANAAATGQDVNAVIKEIQITQANITPMTTANSYRYIGANGTYVTPVSAFESVIGKIDSGVTQITISKSQASALELSLGLNPGSLETRNILSIVGDITDRNPRPPTSGNALFLGTGKGLPGGSPELVIDAIPSAGGNGIRQIIVKIK